MYGVPGRSVLRKKDARVRIPSLASLKSFTDFLFYIIIICHYRSYGGKEYLQKENIHQHHQHTESTTDPCFGKLSDLEYLEHMIPHHQVAIDMSKMLIPHTNNPVILHLCRDIIRKQDYEIWEMEMIKKQHLIHYLCKMTLNTKIISNKIRSL